MTDKPIADLTGKYPDMDHYVSIPVAELNGLRAENERLKAENRSLAQRRVDITENERLRDLIRTAHDNADYIVSMLKSSSDALTVWPQTWHAVMLVKAEGIMALEDLARDNVEQPERRFKPTQHAEYERLREDNAVIMAADKATQAENERLLAALRAVLGEYAKSGMDARLSQAIEELDRDNGKPRAEAYEDLLNAYERLRTTLEKIATDYYHDQHAIWAAEALTRMAEP